MTVTAAISLGASFGDRARTIRMATAGVDALDGVRVTGASRVYLTAPVGGVARAPFYNAVLRVDTVMEPLSLLAALRAIETRLGRRPARRWADRALDLDLLLFGNEVIRGSPLEVPHPRLAERPFLLALLYEAWPDAPNPWTGLPWRWGLPVERPPGAVGVLRRSRP